MLTIDKVSERAKNRVVEILDRGVTETNLRICATGLAADKLTGGIDSLTTDGMLDVRKAMTLAAEANNELNSDERGYVELALRIYTYSIVEEQLQAELDRVYGPKM